jgi:hypothetical protein
MNKEQYADKLLSYIQSDLFHAKDLSDHMAQKSNFYVKKIKEYFEEFGDSYSPNAQDIELSENKEVVEIVGQNELNHEKEGKTMKNMEK